MVAASWSVLVLSSVVLILGVFSSRPGGRNLALAGGTLASGAASFLFNDLVIRGSFWALAVILLLAGVLSIGRSTWSGVRPLLVFAGLAMVALLAFYFVENGSPGMRTTALIAVVLCTTVFVALLLREIPRVWAASRLPRR
jgi:hypothetical protein